LKPIRRAKRNAPSAHKEHVIGTFHHQACDPGWGLMNLSAPCRAATVREAIHDTRVQLDLPLIVGQPAVSDARVKSASALDRGAAVRRFSCTTGSAETVASPRAQSLRVVQAPCPHGARAYAQLSHATGPAITQCITLAEGRQSCQAWALTDRALAVSPTPLPATLARVLAGHTTI